MNHKLSMLLIFSALIISCVSVNLPTGKIAKAEKIKLQEPAAPFKTIDNATIDRAWQNIKNGNTFAYLSECNSKTDISLQTMEIESLAALSSAKIMKSEMNEYNGREGKLILAEGQVDGVLVRLQIQLLRKNGCNYTISFVGRKKYFDSDLPLFEKFLKEFEIP